MHQYKNLLERFSQGFDRLSKDVVFVFDGGTGQRRTKRKKLRQELKSNKFLLSLASPVFNAMFNGPLSEQSDRIYIKDVEYGAFEMMLKFICLKETKFDSVDEALRTYTAADKYDIPDLCASINDYLLTKITSETVCQIYEHSQVHVVSRLKDTCVRCFIQEIDRILVSHGFLHATTSTINDIYTSHGLEIEDERILCDGLVRYVTHNNVNLKQIQKYLRPALNSIRFLTLDATFIQKLDRILTRHDQKTLIKALDNSKTRLPRNFNTSRKQRYWKQAPLTDKELHCFYF